MAQDWFKQRLKDRSDKKFQHMIGKRVEFKTLDGKRHVGVAEFIGHNDTLGFDQVTIDRTPVRKPNFKTLKLVKCQH